MKLPKIRSGKAFAVFTGLYLLCSLFGSALYLILPPVLCSIGARIHAYLLINSAMHSDASVWSVILIVTAHLYVLAMTIAGIRAVFMGLSPLYCAMVGVEVVLTFLFLILPHENAFHHTEGILVNAAYCLWLLQMFVLKSPATVSRQPRKKGK